MILLSKRIIDYDGKRFNQGEPNVPPSDSY